MTCELVAGDAEALDVGKADITLVASELLGDAACVKGGGRGGDGRARRGG